MRKRDDLLRQLEEQEKKLLEYRDKEEQTPEDLKAVNSICDDIEALNAEIDTVERSERAISDMRRPEEAPPKQEEPEEVDKFRSFGVSFFFLNRSYWSNYLWLSFWLIQSKPNYHCGSSKQSNNDHPDYHQLDRKT